MRERYRVGFIIDGKIPNLGSWLNRECGLAELFLGWPTDSATTLMRFGWIADTVNAADHMGLSYELYRPWRRYDVVIFLKSMSEECVQLAKELYAKQVRTIFDINVDYTTPAAGRFYYDGMAPSAQQTERARDMCRWCSAVLCASRYIAAAVSEYNERVFWLPDNVRDDLISIQSVREPEAGGRVQLLWSGQAAKLFELLRIGEVLHAFADRVHLKIVTNSLSAVEKWYEPYGRRFSALLDGLSHEIITFTTIEDLMAVYREGGVCISPRFLDNTYNRGHSEWKISLALACGCPVLASEQDSYIAVADRASAGTVTIARDDREWSRAFEVFCSGDYPWSEAASGATRVVREHYATSVIASRHAAIVSGRF